MSVLSFSMTQQAPAADFEEWIPRAQRRVAGYMGISGPVWDSIKGTKAGNWVVFQGVAIPAAALSFGAASYCFASGLLDYGTFAALGVGLAATAGLATIDHTTVLQTRGTPAASRGKAWLVRIVSITMMIGAGFFAATKSHHEDIERQQADSAKVKLEQLALDPRYAPELESSRKALKISSEKPARVKVVVASVMQPSAECRCSPIAI